MRSLADLPERRWLFRMSRIVALLLPIVPAALADGLQDQELVAQRSAPVTLRADTRLVVEDITVTDAAGKPVEGLPRSAFHITDDGQPQALRSFAETVAAKQPARAAAKPGVLSNASTVDSSANLSVLLIDPIGVEVADQMFLRLQALKFLESLPEGTAVAIFRTSRDGRPLLVQSATGDRTLLTKAINNSVPTLAVSVPANEVFFNTIGELSNIAEYLGQMKGHKSLIWLAGKFPLAEVLGGNGAQQAGAFEETQEAMKSVYRKLEAARVSVSPIDLRGVVNASINLNLPARTQPGAASAPTMFAGQAAEQQGSWSAMDAIAAATGGRAYYSNNKLTEQIRSAVEMGRHFYTLTYSPKPYTEDGKWHTIRLAVDGPFSLSYREGYFAQPSLEILRMEAAMTKANGKFTIPDAPPNVPIVFEARIRPVEAQGGALEIAYTIAANDLSFRVSGNGERQARLKVAAMSYDMSGQVKTNAIDEITTRYSEAQMVTARRIGIPILQNLPVSRGTKFVLLSVIDLATGRTGTVQLTLASAYSFNREGAHQGSSQGRQ